MKSTALLWLLPLLAGSACATQPALNLPPVGPAEIHATTSDHTGTLVVYSAYSVHGSSTTEPDDIQHYTAYNLLSADGTPLQTVQNEAGPFGAEPAAVSLAPGRYLIRARTNGSGLVTLPVVVVADKTTTVHLEGGYTDANLPADAAVKLPNGQIIGWKAASL